MNDDRENVNRLLEKFSQQTHHTENLDVRIQTPLNIKQFKSRINTFSVVNWYDKPFAIRPPVCARYGYKCIGPDLIECVDCGQKLSFSIPASLLQYLDERALEMHANHFITRMKEAHPPHCVYYSNPCPVQFILFAHQYSYHENENPSDTYSTGKIHQIKFTSRFKDILSFTDVAVPELTQSFTKNYVEMYRDDFRRILGDVFPELCNDDQIITSRTENNFWIAIFSWKIRPQSEHNIDRKAFYCEYCQARVTLDVNTSEFDPCEGHRWWCPCVHEVKSMDDSHLYQSQASTDNSDNSESSMRTLFIPDQLPGWKQVFFAIRSRKRTDESLYLKYDTMEVYDKLRHAGRLLDSTLSPAFLRKKEKQRRIYQILEEREKATQVQQESEQAEHSLTEPAPEPESEPVISQEEAQQTTTQQPVVSEMIDEEPVQPTSNSINIGTPAPVESEPETEVIVLDPEETSNVTIRNVPESEVSNEPPPPVVPEEGLSSRKQEKQIVPSVERTTEDSESEDIQSTPSRDVEMISDSESLDAAPKVGGSKTDGRIITLPTSSSYDKPITTQPAETPTQPKRPARMSTLTATKSSSKKFGNRRGKFSGKRKAGGGQPAGKKKRS